jgi:hypothetical protein
MDTHETVPPSEFTRNFGRYRMRVQRERLAVSSHGQITGHFVDQDEDEKFKRFRASGKAAAAYPLRGRARKQPWHDEQPIIHSRRRATAPRSRRREAPLID